MFDEKVLWKQRFGRTSKELSKYLRYIFNGHIVIVLVFLIGTAAFYYQEWISTLSQSFPVSIIMAAIIGLLLTYTPIYTFLMEADRVFLIPLEERLGGYFQRSMVVSFVVQLYLLIMGLAVLMPLYAHVHNGSYNNFLPFLLILAIVKIMNLMIRWRVQFYVDTNVHKIDSVVRYFVNGVFLYFLFAGAVVWFFIPVVLIFVVLYGVYYSQTKQRGLKWEYLIEQEERRMMSFYRLANMFTDVPKLRDQVKRRKWLDWISSFLKYRTEGVYTHLFVHTFIRGGDFLGLFIRLTAIGMFALYFITFGNGQILFVLLFLFLTGFQLLPLWNHHQNKIWLNLYPVREELKGESFKKVLVVLMFIQSFLLSVPLFLKAEWFIGLVSIAAGFAFSYIFVFVYNGSKLKA
ncbi:ABC transporter permease [Robertmurraya kyonggiensis]|uniref:ABC transporter permease n=1 Tax=Robertmurraya kyonggiensis TaxID=1037680 RepID=A0A4U1D6D8_9BACI|nr:ABC transporter permease [Robertmurraya kyonggiensis]TKC18165.1 ABC transporter permease [Robertmurraya kyonggiensis]